MAFGNEIKQGNIIENWLFDFANDNSGYLRFAFADVTDSSNFYHGVILMGNKPSIRESIDLATSTAKSSNISISIPDFNYQGSPVSKELFGGSNHYINQTVAVYSKVNAGTKQQIGSFRLTDISSNGDTIQLSLSTHRPWDFISLPQDQSDNNVYAPIAYGDYDANNATTETKKNKVFPIPVVKATGGKIYFAMHKAISDSSLLLNYHDASSDLFPVLTADTNTTSKYGITTVGVDVNITRKFRLYGDSATDATGTAWSNEANILALSGTATIGTPTAVVNTATDYIDVELPDFSGSLSDLKVYVKGSISPAERAGDSGDGKIDIKVYGTALTALSHASGSTGTTSGSSDIDSSGTEFSVVNFNSYLDNQDAPPDKLSVGTRVTAGEYDASLINVYLTATASVSTDEPDSAGRERKDLNYVYCGADGLDKSYTGGSGSVTEIHEAHRDLLHRFAGVNESDANIDGWTALESDKNWEIRYWQLQPAELQKTLEKLQYEGGFVFRFKADGSPQYIHIKDSYGSTDATLTKSDISDVSVKPSPMSELLTKMDIHYEKHPAEDRYLTSKTAYAHTARTNWNIQAKENIQKVNLDAYISPTITQYDNNTGTSTDVNQSSPNDDFFAYYYNIFGDIKLIVDCTIVNPKYYDLEVGDVVDFSDMHPETPYGYNSANWSGIKFMIISLNRTLGEMQITARQIT